MAGHTRMKAQTRAAHTKTLALAHTSHSHTWGDESGTGERFGRPKLAPLRESQLKRQLFAERESSCSQSRNSLMSSCGKARRHALIHEGERGIIRITQPFIDGRRVS